MGNLSQSRILICNDDGIQAKGIQVLERVARLFSDDVWVVAPQTEQSGKSHSFTIGTDLIAKRVAERHFSVAGTPTDCVLFACNVLMKDKKPDFVLSGINHGENVGLDLLYSGTVGIALEGALQGAKSFAFSLAGAKKTSDFWDITERRAEQVFSYFADFREADFLNVNFPATASLAPVKLTTVADRKIGDDIKVLLNENEKIVFSIQSTRSDYQKNDMTDAEAIENGFVSITSVQVKLFQPAFLNNSVSLVTG